MAIIQEMGGTLYIAIPKTEAQRFNWKKGTKLAVGRIDSVQRKLVVEEIN